MRNNQEEKKKATDLAATRTGEKGFYLKYTNYKIYFSFLTSQRRNKTLSD
jgi:hypothetical protein